MAVEVLRPQDPLRDRIHTHTSPFHRRRNIPATANIPNLTVNQRKHPNTTQKKTNHNTNVNTSPKPDKKKIKKSPRSPQGGGGAAAAAPVVGQVMILKRGESLSSISHSSRVENPNPSPSLNPVPNPNPNSNFNSKSQQSVNGFRKINASDMYAGSGFVISPSPQSLPFPSFFGRKGSSDDASENLKRLLRL